MLTEHHDGPYGRMRSRAVGDRVPGVPQVVLVQGLGVSGYLLPALRALAGWTRAYLVELPGLCGSGEPPHELDLPGYAAAVADWVTARGEPVVLAGHSAGCQVAARAAVGHPLVSGVVLASPTVDPDARSLLRLARRWRRDGSREPGGLTRSHLPEWWRAGPHRLLRLVQLCIADDIAESVRAIDVPLLGLYGRDDAISDEQWVRDLVQLAPHSRLVLVPGAHTFVWSHPDAWCAPVRDFATGLAAQPTAP